MIEKMTLTTVSRIDVSIQGSWTGREHRDWRGTAASSEPCVAVSFLRSEGHVEWCQSQRAIENTICLRLALFPYDASNLDVQVNFSIGGGGRRWRSLLPDCKYRPAIPQSFTVRTGDVFVFATIEGKPRMDLLGLFLVRRDVKSARNGVWHIRPDLIEGAGQPMRQILLHGRAGEFDEQGSPSANHRL